MTQEQRSCAGRRQSDDPALVLICIMAKLAVGLIVGTSIGFIVGGLMCG